MINILIKYMFDYKNGYELGSNLAMEMSVRNFLRSFFLSNIYEQDRSVYHNKHNYTYKIHMNNRYFILVLLFRCKQYLK